MQESLMKFKTCPTDLYTAQTINNQTRPCLLRCNRQSETVTVTSAKYPTKATFNSQRDICLALQKVARVCSKRFRREVFEGSLEYNISCDQILLANGSIDFCNENDLPLFNHSEQNKMLSDFLFSYAKNNFAVVSVLIRDPFYTSILRDEEISLSTYLGNAGGLLGLFLGVSLVSLFEIFYQLFDFAFVNFYFVFFKSPYAKGYLRNTKINRSRQN
jgi:hypothetical protein